MKVLKNYSFWLFAGKLPIWLAAIGITVLSLFVPHNVLAWPLMPLVDGVINVGEYGSHTDGQNQQTNGGQVWYMTWDDDNLYIGISGANLSEGAVVYIDRNPLAPINGGANSNGTLAGQNYDGTNFTALQFRADFVAYFDSGYREYRTANGAGGWSAETTGFGTYTDNGTNIRELSIPWSSITGSGRPASFAWFGYLTSSGGYVYGQVPTENSGGNIGTSAYYSRYYIVSSTADGASTPPFSRNSYVFNGTTDISGFGAINVYDFTMNTLGRTITRSGGAGGDWVITGNLRVNAGAVNFGSSATLADVSGDILIGSGGTLVLSSVTGGDLQVAGNFTQNGTFTPNNRTVFFNGTNLVSSSVIYEVDFDNVIINTGSTLQVGNNNHLGVSQNATNNGSLGGSGGFVFRGATFTNNGAVTIDYFRFNGGSQSVAGVGTWTGFSLEVLSGANVSLANAITFEASSIYVSGTVSGSNAFRTSGSVVFYQNGTFSAPFRVQSGTTRGWCSGYSHWNGPITVETGASFQVEDNDSVYAEGNVTVNGDLGGSGNFTFRGATFTNNGAVTIDYFRFNGSSQSVAGVGTWTGFSLEVLSSANVSLANAITFEASSIYVSGTVSGSNAFRTSGSVVFYQNGTFSAPFRVQSGTTRGWCSGYSHWNGPITVETGASFQVEDNDSVYAEGNVTVNGDLGGSGNFTFRGATFTNNGAVTIDYFRFNGSSQSVAGVGTWTGFSLEVLSGANVSLANAITFEASSIYVSGTVSGSNAFRTSGSVVFYQNGTFSAPFRVQSGTTRGWCSGYSHWNGPITVETGASFQVEDNDSVYAEGNVTVNGDLGGSGNFTFRGATFTNNGAVTIDYFRFNGSSQSVAGVGTWTGFSLEVLSGANVSLANAITFEASSIYVSGTVSGSNAFRTSGSVVLYQNGTFSAPFEVQAGTTMVTPYNTSPTFNGPIIIDAGATLQVDNAQSLHAYGNVLVNGELSGVSARFYFYGSTFTNNSNSVTIDIFVFAGTGAQSIIGAGAWTGEYIAIGSASVTSLASDVTLSVDELHLDGSLNLNTHTLTFNGLAVTNSGILSGETGTLAFDNTSTLSGSGAYNLHHVAIGATGNLTAPSTNINISGDWHNAGVFNHNNGSLTFNGSTSQNLILDAATAFYDLQVNSGSTLIEVGAADHASVVNTLTNNGTIRKTLFANGGGGLTGVQLSTYTDLASLQIDRIDQNIPNATGPLATGIHWVLTPAGNGSVSVTLSDTPPGHPTIPFANRACYDSGDGSPFTCANPASLTINNINGATLLANPYWAVGAAAGPTAVTLLRLNAHNGHNQAAWAAGLMLLTILGFLLTRKIRQVLG